MAADWAIVEEYEDGGVIDRYETEREALDVLEQDLKDGTATEEYAVKWVFDPSDDSPREPSYPIGPFGGFYTAPGEGGLSWGRDGCWYGGDVGGDEAVSLAFVAHYILPVSDEVTKRCDIYYYPYGKPGNYGVVEETQVYDVDANGEPISDQEIVNEGLAPSFETLDDAMAYAKKQAEIDQRWIL